MRGALILLAPLAGASFLASRYDLDDCPGYRASNIKQLGQRLTADLSLAGDACNTYGSDLLDLKLLVEEQSGTSPSSPHRQVDTYRKQKTASTS